MHACDPRYHDTWLGFLRCVVPASQAWPAAPVPRWYGETEDRLDRGTATCNKRHVLGPGSMTMTRWGRGQPSRRVWACVWELAEEGGVGCRLRAWICQEIKMRLPAAHKQHTAAAALGGIWY